MLQKEFGDYLKEIRKARGITLETLAKHLNVSLSFLCDIEKKRRPPLNEEKMEKLGNYLSLAKEEKEKLYDLKAQYEQNTPADIKEVILYNEASDLVRIALRKPCEIGAIKKIGSICTAFLL